MQTIKRMFIIIEIKTNIVKIFMKRKDVMIFPS